MDKILIAENGSNYQVVAAVINREEAEEMAASYVSTGAAGDCLCPERFVMISRDEYGWFTKREVIEELGDDGDETLDLLSDIKKLWDAEGFGSDDNVSEPLYARLKAAIEQRKQEAK